MGLNPAKVGLNSTTLKRLAWRLAPGRPLVDFSLFCMKNELGKALTAGKASFFDSLKVVGFRPVLLEHVHGKHS